MTKLAYDTTTVPVNKVIAAMHEYKTAMMPALLEEYVCEDPAFHPEDRKAMIKFYSHDVDWVAKMFIENYISLDYKDVKKAALSLFNETMTDDPNIRYGNKPIPELEPISFITVINFIACYRDHRLQDLIDKFIATHKNSDEKLLNRLVEHRQCNISNLIFYVIFYLIGDSNDDLARASISYYCGPPESLHDLLYRPKFMCPLSKEELKQGITDNK